MEKIYGYKEKDLIDLAGFLRETDKTVLSEVFSEFAVRKNKSKGTVRNLYYALVKLSALDKEFTALYLDGKPLTVHKTERFTECEERALLSKVLTAKVKGRSVRNAIAEISCGDEKSALRFQNKYRSLMSGNSRVKTEVVKAIKEKYPDFNANASRKSGTFNDFQVKRVGTEINAMIERLTLGLKKENEFYKRQVEILRTENEKLSRSVFGDNGRRALDFFACKTKAKGKNLSD